ncbi:MAG: hypothetical protein NT031_16510 [Planctomycetota bacterium]|nr:hypothetical protein [Planctomycetota bacterium]
MRILTERAGELEKKGLAILLVHASPAPAGQAALPSGDLPAEGKLAAKALRAWGVQGLPWLILTDEHGRVTAEGFNPDAIDEAMK